VTEINRIKLTACYGVRSAPNLLFFKNGEVKDQFIGACITKEQLRVKLETLL
jgi:thioredoxin 1